MSRLSCIFGLLLCACTAETGDAIVDHHPPYVEPETPDDLPPPGSALPPLTRAPIAPPAISGGHVAIVGRRVVVGDPDRERALVFDLDADRLIAELPLAGEPGRVVAGESGLVFVALRDGGAVAVIDPATATLQTRYPVCPSPRGLAEAGGQLHVACLGGALITFAALTGDEMARAWLPPDLRDVVLVGEQRWVSRFRSAEVLIVAPNGRIEATLTPPPRAVDGQYQVPHVAWRLRPRPGGGVTLLHQLAGHAKVDIRRSGGYGDPIEPAGCDAGIVQSAVTEFDVGGNVVRSQPLAGTVLAVDFAQAGPQLAVAVAGARAGLAGLRLYDVPAERGTHCLFGDDRFGIGQPSVAVEAADGGEIVWWRRETASLLIDRGAPEPRRIDAGGDTCADAGHTLFHTDAGAGIACASCHPEGGDDGHVWQFDDALRRTPSLRGGLIGAAPYHWEGDLPDFGALVEEVFEHRMGGPSLPADWRDAFLGWLDTLAEPEADLGLDAAAVARGEQVFNDETVGCTECHAGALLSDRKAHDVGTGGPFITPRLAGLGLRGPYLHDGCAPTLADRFTACGGGEEHGRTAHLSADQRADLIAWLRAR